MSRKGPMGIRKLRGQCDSGFVIIFSGSHIAQIAQHIRPRVTEERMSRNVTSQRIDKTKRLFISASKPEVLRERG